MKGLKFDRRIVLLLAVLLVALVGYLFIRFSRAGIEKDYAYNMTHDGGITTVAVSDPSISPVLKTFSLPVQPTCYSGGWPLEYERILKMPGTDYAYAIPQHCLGDYVQGTTPDMTSKVAIINTQNHSYSGTSIDVTFPKSAALDAVVNPQKKHLYIFDTNVRPGNLVVIDAATNKVIKKLTLNTYGRAVQLVPNGDGTKLAVLYARSSTGVPAPAGYSSLITFDTTAYEVVGRGMVADGFMHHGTTTGSSASADPSGKYLYAIVPVYEVGSSGYYSKIKIAKIDLVSMQSTYSADLPAMVNCYTSRGVDMVTTARGVYFLAGTNCAGSGREEAVESRMYLYSPTSQGISQVLGKEVGNATRLFAKSDGSGLYITAVDPTSGTFLSSYSFANSSLVKAVLGDIRSIIPGGIISTGTAAPTTTVTPTTAPVSPTPVVTQPAAPSPAVSTL